MYFDNTVGALGILYYPLRSCRNSWKTLWLITNWECPSKRDRLISFSIPRGSCGSWKASQRLEGKMRDHLVSFRVLHKVLGAEGVTCSAGGMAGHCAGWITRRRSLSLSPTHRSLNKGSLRQVLASSCTPLASRYCLSPPSPPLDPCVSCMQSFEEYRSQYVFVFTSFLPPPTHYHLCRQCRLSLICTLRK